MKTQAHPNRNLTTSFPDTFLRELDRVAKEMRVQKNEILMQAFTAWSKRRQQELLRESYQRIPKRVREELIELADEGLEAWHTRIDA